MNNQNGNMYQQQPAPQQPVQQPYRPPVNQAYGQQPVASAPQPVRPVYQQPIVPNQTRQRQKSQYTILAQNAVGSMNKAVFVILSVVFGWICSRSIFSMEFGIGLATAGLLFYLIYIPFIIFKQGKKFSLAGWLLFIPQIIILASFAFFSAGW